jgi:hypothetical protein
LALIVLSRFGLLLFRDDSNVGPSFGAAGCLGRRSSPSRSNNDLSLPSCSGSAFALASEDSKLDTGEWYDSVRCGDSDRLGGDCAVELDIWPGERSPRSTSMLSSSRLIELRRSVSQLSLLSSAERGCRASSSVLLLVALQMSVSRWPYIVLTLAADLCDLAGRADQPLSCGLSY